MKLDPVSLSEDNTRQKLQNALDVRGLDAVVYGSSIIQNGYSGIVGGQSTVQDTQPRGSSFKLFLNLPINGLAGSWNRISISDKTDKEMTITTLTQLFFEDRVVITHPDQKVWELKVVEALTDHFASTFAYNYKAIIKSD